MKTVSFIHGGISVSQVKGNKIGQFIILMAVGWIHGTEKTKKRLKLGSGQLLLRVSISDTKAARQLH